MIEIEVQNETHQSQERLRFAAVPRIGEGIRLQGPDGFWASYDVVDLWYQKAEYGDVWVPYLHVRLTPAPHAAEPIPIHAAANANGFGTVTGPRAGQGLGLEAGFGSDEGFGAEEVYPFTA